VAKDVQNATKNMTLGDPAVKAVANALVKSRLLNTPRRFLELLESVRQMATLLAIGESAKVHLRGRDADAMSLNRLAIPLSSNSDSWYHPAANWAVAPVCRIDPRKVKLQMKVDPGPMQTAVNRISATKLYFVHTYSRSNSRMLQNKQNA
jgi:hypothetical protein